MIGSRIGCSLRFNEHTSIGIVLSTVLKEISESEEEESDVAKDLTDVFDEFAKVTAFAVGPVKVGLTPLAL